ncbi:Piso0_001300 [Millerozyma farinosa CBS 7064]|uniref:Piso0_001300 protein n=1 Tax=Pichia sorbitophila (strain ATCC MYA-4447 / BCRC 22081 / CBS 7064 / NBRC 10061 / NRRL Y-12695) TaxID=559304 RepID=G8YMT0_PICSO|nr:Piso0_001300 [Millerozyma farinosa CBS 7064]
MSNQINRPCDVCYLRKVKCNRESPCLRCIKHGVVCTNNRPKRHGDKKKKKDIIIASKSTDNGRLIDYCTLTEILQVYDESFYGTWPILSVEKLLEDVRELKVPNLSYALTCAMGAAISKRVQSLSSGNLTLQSNAQRLAKEAITVSSNLKSKDNFSVILLISFFLYIYFCNLPDCKNESLLCLREAISIAEIMGYHFPSTYSQKSKEEAHQCRKVYYVLYISERYASIRHNFPLVLEASIPFPRSDDEEKSSISGFIELIRLFALPRNVFSEIFHRNTTNESRNSYQLICNAQEYFTNIEINEKMSDIDKANLILTKSWIRIFIWKRQLKSSSNSFFAPEFPIEVIVDFFDCMRNLQRNAVIANGPGACVKIMELIESLLCNLLPSNLFLDTTMDAISILSNLLLGMGLDSTIEFKNYEIKRRTLYLPANLVSDEILSMIHSSDSIGLIESPSLFEENYEASSENGSLY